MQVYIEYAFIDNMIINFILIRASTKIIRVKSSVVFQLVSALIGTLVAIVIPLFSLSNVCFIIVKITLAFLMVYVSSKFYSVKKYFLTVLTFVILTFLSGGFIIALFNLVGVDYERYFILNYDSVLPIGISVLIIYILYSVLISLCLAFFKERNFRPFIRTCVVTVNKKSVKTRGFIDSGNCLYDKKLALPISVLSTSLFKKLEKLGLRKSVSSIVFDTVSGTAEMKLYIIDKLSIYNGVSVNILNNVLVGVSPSNFHGGDYDILLNPDLV